MTSGKGVRCVCEGRAVNNGPNAAALQTPANNIPWQSAWDARRACEQIRAQLPKALQPTSTAWAKATAKAFVMPQRGGAFVSTKQVLALF